MNVFDLFAKLGLDTSEYENGLSNAESLGSRFGSGIRTASRVAGAAILGASTAVVGFGATAVRAGMDFDSSMSQVAATMGTTVDEIENLRDFAQEMGSTTAFSATQAADALNYMALAGYDAETSMSMLPNVLNLAAAGDIDLARASDMVTDAQSALGLSLEDTSIMVDQMAAAASASNTSVEQLGDAFLTIGATASNLAGGTNELATVLGVLADNGIKGAEGGTHLRNMILSLTNPTDAAADALEAFGIEIYDQEGDMRSMIDIIGDLNGAMDGFSQSQRDALIGTIFNRADMASVNALLNTSAERFDELSVTIGESAGAAQAMADTQLDNLAGDVTLFQSALEGARIAVSDALTPSLREFVQLGSEGLSSITQGFQEGGLEGAMDSLGTWISDALTMIVSKAPDIIRAGTRLLSALGTALVDNAPMIAESTLEVAQYLIDSFAEAVDGEGATNLMDTTMQIVSMFGEFLVDNAPVLIESTAQLISQFVTFIADPANQEMLLNLSFDLITAIADGLVQAAPVIAQLIPMLIANNIQVAVNEFPKLLETVGNLLGDLALMVFGIIGGMMGMTHDEIIGSITAIGDSVSQSFSDFLNGFTTWASDVGAGVELMWSDITSFFSDGITNIGEALSGWWDELTQFGADLASSALTWAQDMIDNFISGITNGVASVGEAVSGLAQSVRDRIGFSEPEIGPLSNFHTYAPDMVDLFTSGIYEGRNRIEEAFSDVFSMPDAESSYSIAAAGAVDNIATSTVSVNQQPIVVQAYFGNEKFDEFVVDSKQRTDHISGGRG